MSTDYNARAETTVPLDEKHTGAVLDALAAYHPAVGRSPFGRAEVIVTLPAENVAQAAATATAVIASAIAPAELLGIDIATTADFDRRVGLAPLPELVSVTEAATELGVTRQAVLQRIESGSLPASRIGNGWAIPAAAVTALAGTASGTGAAFDATVVISHGDPKPPAVPRTAPKRRAAKTSG